MSRSVRRGSVSPGSKELFAMKMKGLQDFKVRVSRIVKDYLIANDYEDFVSRINELEPKKSEIEQIPKILMSISFDRNDNERKVVSDLIVKLVMNKVIKEKDLGMGFSLLLSQVPDLRLDVPNVVQYLEYFVDSFVNNKVLKYGDSSKFVEVLSIYSGSNPRKTIKKIVEKIIKNYFVSGELEECQRAIEEINDTNLYPLVVKYVVSLSFDFGASQRELVSQLFAKVVDDHVETKFIQQKHLGEGFILLLNNAEDLSKDVPEVFDYLSFFIARAISDESLPRSFVKNSAEKTTNDALIVLENVDQLIHMENSTEKLLYVWETNIEEVDEIKLVVKENVEEFFDRDCDLATIQRFLNKLEHPHFHYQVVYQLFATLLERDEKHIDQVGRTIKAIYNLGVTSLDEIEKGFRKIFALLPELKKMAPSAEEIYGKLRHSVMTDKKTK